ALKVPERTWFAVALAALMLVLPGIDSGRGAVAEAGPLEFTGDRLKPLPGLGRVVILDDFNADGRLDLLTTGDRPGSETDSLVLLPGLGEGRFGRAQSFPVFPNVVDVVAADFNHDGRPDVAVLTTRVRLFVFENRTPVGSATFEIELAQSPRLPRANFQALRLGDSDGDGWEDLFLWHPTAPEVLLYRNEGTAPGGFPSFTQEYSFVPETRNFASSFAVEDFTGDGLSDVALLRGDPFEQVRQVEIYRALESPEGEEPPLELHFTVPLTGFPGQMVAGRIDEDEFLDLLVVSDFQRRLELFRGDSEEDLPTGRFVRLGEIEMGPRQRQGQFILADLNSDGLTDIVDPEVQVFYQEPSAVEGQAAFSRVALPAVEGSRFGVADLNGNGLPDLVSTMGEQPFAGVFLAREGPMGEPPQFGASNFLDVGRLEHLVAAADIDGDGRSDLAVAIEPLDTTGDGIIVLESLGGGQFQVAGEIALSGRAEQLKWFDLTGDGAAELVVLQSAPDEVRVYEVEFVRAPALLFSAEVASRPRRFHLTDFDGDGAADLALAHDGSFSTGEEARLSLWQGLGEESFVLT
ncbi:MAG TPA: VCBS repeat-containing protein, partial [Firmicutes bacterium]|nr:VCBS repeat-containing protein [Bacillota bacterium]